MGRKLRWAWCWLFICLTAQSAWIPLASAVEAISNSSGTVDPPASGSQSLYQTISGHVKGAVTLGGGVRYDQMDWNIAGTLAGTNPNVLSELAWSDIESYQLSLGVKAQIARHFYSRGHVNYAWIDSGTVRDSDYGGDNRTQEWSRSISETNDTSLWDVVLGGGYPFTFNQRRWLLAPMLGGSLHKQNLRITNGEQVLSAQPPGNRPPPALGPLSRDLDSLYEALWMSLWSGVDVRYELPAEPKQAPFMAWGLSLAYHFWGDYEAKADWNLRQDLRHPVSFEHEADGSGISLQAEWLIRANRYLNVNLNWNYCRWETDPGTATFHLSNGSERTQRLNAVNWESQSFMLGLALRFY